jgi:hypothetical protein
MWNNVLARSETVSKPIVNSGVSGPQKMRACDQAQNCKGDVRPTLLARADEVIELDCCSLHLLTAASGTFATCRLLPECPLIGVHRM